jgi:hypothetical protein
MGLSKTGASALGQLAPIVVGIILDERVNGIQKLFGH